VEQQKALCLKTKVYATALEVFFPYISNTYNKKGLKEARLRGRKEASYNPSKIRCFLLKLKLCYTHFLTQKQRPKKCQRKKPKTNTTQPKLKS
jgi:hypothetical protein|tara:strand:+ start:1156 stop:1434 length:279 start_codon:yes stop_codon:yes gene_type:complete